MDRPEVPDWKNMPEEVPIVILCWEDVYLTASDELERSPTKKEVGELFDEALHALKQVIGDSFSEDLAGVVSFEVPHMLEDKKYDLKNMSDEELVFDKYCHECKKVQETCWEENYCDKNPKALDDPKTEHGDDHLCGDGDCEPNSREVDTDNINRSYIETHSVFEQCVECGAYFDDTSPQAEDKPRKATCGHIRHIEADDRRIELSIESSVSQRLTEPMLNIIAEEFLNQNIPAWHSDGEEIHDHYTLNIDERIALANEDDDHVSITITSGKKDCGVLDAYCLKVA